MKVIVSHREIIKPSSLTPSHLKTYNLSLIDQVAASTFIPFVAFYPNTNIHGSSHDKALDLKKSLSKTLTKYYPFAGRHPKIDPTCVNCNDDGAEFLEASVDSTLSDFLQMSQHDDLDQLLPNGLAWFKSNYGYHDQSDNVAPVAVQVNHFECGGIALAVSLSHKVADGSSLICFLNDWAKVTQSYSIEPHFISFQHTNLNNSEFSSMGSNDFVVRSFKFPNTKIHNLKQKVTSMTADSGQPITNPTRVEVLTWLLYKCAVASAIKNVSGSFKPTGIILPANMRRKMIGALPVNCIGNILGEIAIETKNESEMKPEFFIGELKKKKMELEGLKDLETVWGHLFSNTDLEEQQTRVGVTYFCSSFCGYPAYGIDFGWGKPIKTIMAGNPGVSSFTLMDAPDGVGIEAIVCLSKRDMGIFQSDPELLAFF